MGRERQPYIAPIDVTGHVIEDADGTWRLDPDVAEIVRQQAQEASVDKRKKPSKLRRRLAAFAVCCAVAEGLDFGGFAAGDMLVRSTTHDLPIGSTQEANPLLLLQNYVDNRHDMIKTAFNKVIGVE